MASTGRVRAAFATAAAVVLLLAGVAFRTRASASGERAPQLPAPAGREAAHAVGFTLQLKDADARRVTLAGDFNDWSPTALPMRRDPVTGTWRVQVHLVPGRHEYSYVVNGTRWIIDPLAPRTMEQTMGPANVIAVPGDL